MRFFLILLASFYLNTAVAETHSTEIFPAACKAFAIKGEDLHITAGNVRVLMVHNLSAFDVWMAIGMIVYFTFSRKSSLLSPQNIPVTGTD